MQFQTLYESPVGRICLTANDTALICAQFDEMPTQQIDENPVLIQTRTWLDCYFDGKDPGAPPPLYPEGTPFQMRIWRLMQGIPYGSLATYGMLAELAAAEMQIPKMAAQAVGGAVRRNPIAILIPCHRVIGKDGNLVGYFGGMKRKIELLQLEGHDTRQFTLPKR